MLSWNTQLSAFQNILSCWDVRYQLRKKFIDFTCPKFSPVNSKWVMTKQLAHSEQSHTTHTESTLNILGKYTDLRLLEAFATILSTLCGCNMQMIVLSIYSTWNLDIASGLFWICKLYPPLVKQFVVTNKFKTDVKIKIN